MNATSTTGLLLARSAADLIGTPFRLFGRDAERGLDCVGLIHVSLQRIGIEAKAPAGYRLRNSDPARWFAFAKNYGLTDVDDAITNGDVIVVQPGPGQQHVMICERSGVAIHAHAGLGRVVREHIGAEPLTLAHWRLI